jgi:DNA helicase HerA-like ATPase
MPASPLPIAKGNETLSLLPGMTNRHGLVAGATGTGKTITLRVLAERLSRIGVPVFLADVKGDLSGMALAAEPDEKMLERVKRLGVTLEPAGTPVVFWDVFGEQGHPLRATVSEMGPVLLSRMLDLNDVQEGVLSLAFKIADDEGLLLLDLKDLRALLQHVAERAGELQKTLGNVSPASVGAIQRQLLVLEQQGGERFFGEPALDLNDLLEVDGRGEGVVNVLAADKLLQSPRLYSTFLLWLLSELYEHLPELGDPEKPRLVFFFDEAHLLFRDAPRPLLEKVEQVVRLVRSKGIGVFFVTQKPLDVPLPAPPPAGAPPPRRDLPAESEDRRGLGHHRARGRRGAGLASRREGNSCPRRSGLRASAAVAPGAALGRGAEAGDEGLPREGQVRGDGGSRVGLRAASGPGG